MSDLPATTALNTRVFPRRVRGWWVSAAVLLACVLTSVAMLPISTRWHNVQALSEAVRHAPTFHPVVPLAQFEAQGGEPPPWTQFAYRFTSLLGHDDLGRSLFYRLLPAFLLSFLVGLCSAGVAVVVGTLWGAGAAMAGGRVDLMMMRVVDVLYGLPYILMVILLKIALTRPLTLLLGGPTKIADLLVLLIAIGGVSWLTMARVVRGQVLSLKQMPFVEAARAAGAGGIHIFRRHYLPNLMGPIVVHATLIVPQAILQESFLSFLGIGIQPPTPSLGNLAAEGVHAVNAYVDFWWLIAFPCGLLVVTLVALNFLGDAIRDTFEPRASTSTWV